MQQLNKTYFEIKRILGDHTEPLESVQLVEIYRRFFKPKKVRVVLLAESHVFTHDGDRKVPIPPIPDLPGYPSQYARFVYCLGYGEKDLTRSAIHPKRDGTPPFWKLLFSCCNHISSLNDFHPILLGQTPTSQRINNKIKLLNQLREQGIWLVDASIVGLYKDGKKIPNMLEALEESWKSYTREVVISANPNHVICIGKGVAGKVESDLKRFFLDRYSVIDQPTAFLSSEKHMVNYKKYSQICNVRNKTLLLHT